MKTKKRLLSILLTLALVLGLMPGMSLTAYADGTTYNPASTYTGFGDLNTNDTEVTLSEVPGKTWYVIANDDSTVTLLSKQSFGNQQFNSATTKGSNYDSSDIKGFVDGLTGEGQPLAGISSVISGLTLIDSGTATFLSPTKRKGAGDNWWLSSGNFTNAYVVDGGTGGITYNGKFVYLEFGVRPAFKLDLSKVTFDSTSETFSLKPSHTHSFNYNATGATITATCTATDTDCGLTNNMATLTIGAPTLTYVGQTGTGISAVATLTDLNNIQGGATVRYYKANADGTDKDGQELGSAPTDAGKYWAEITLGTGENTATAHVVYSIGYAVTFNTNGGSEVPMQVVEPGENATRPTDPTKEGNIFGGWYLIITGDPGGSVGAIDVTAYATVGETVYRALIREGYTPQAACGILGNIPEDCEALACQVSELGPDFESA